MRTLAIDTSGRACSIALFEGELLIADRHVLIGRGHAEAIIPWISELPSGGKADAIIVGCGPGSFTGVRVGIAAARGLALGWGVPVHGMASLALIATQRPEHAPILVAIEGGHGELFLQQFGSDLGESMAGPCSMTSEAAAAKFEEVQIIGNGAARFVDVRGWGQAIDAEPCAALALALPQTLRNLEARPVYGRAPDAKVAIS